MTKSEKQKKDCKHDLGDLSPNIFQEMMRLLSKRDDKPIWSFRNCIKCNKTFICVSYFTEDKTNSSCCLLDDLIAESKKI